MQMKCGISQYYLEKTVHARAFVYAKAAKLSLDELWRPPLSGGWSVGQNIEHLALCIRLFRRLLSPALLVLRPLADCCHKRTYEQYVDNPYLDRRKSVPLPPGTSPDRKSGV